MKAMIIVVITLTFSIPAVAETGCEGKIDLERFSQLIEKLKQEEVWSTERTYSDKEVFLAFHDIVAMGPCVLPEMKKLIAKKKGGSYDELTHNLLLITMEFQLTGAITAEHLLIDFLANTSDEQDSQFECLIHNRFVASHRPNEKSYFPLVNPKHAIDRLVEISQKRFTEKRRLEGIPAILRLLHPDDQLHLYAHIQNALTSSTLAPWLMVILPILDSAYQQTILSDLIKTSENLLEKGAHPIVLRLIPDWGKEACTPEIQERLWALAGSPEVKEVIPALVYCAKNAGGTYQEEARKLLVKMLHSPDFDMFLIATYGLTKWGDDWALSVLCDYFENREAHWELVIDDIASFGPRARPMVPTFFQLLQEPKGDDDEKRLKFSIISAIGRIGFDSPEIVKRLERELWSLDQGEDPCHYAEPILFALVRGSLDTHGLEAVLKILENDQLTSQECWGHPWRRIAGLSLEYFTPAAHIPWTIHRLTENIQKSTTSDVTKALSICVLVDSDFKGRAAEAISAILAHMPCANQDYYTTYWYALGDVGGNDPRIFRLARAKLLENLANHDYDSAYLGALGPNIVGENTKDQELFSGLSEKFSHLLSLPQTNHYFARLKYIDVIAKFELPTVPLVLSQALTFPNAHVRFRSITTLANLGEKSETVLALLMLSRDDYVALAAASALGTLNGPSKETKQAAEALAKDLHLNPDMQYALRQLMAK